MDPKQMTAPPEEIPSGGFFIKRQTKQSKKYTQKYTHDTKKHPTATADKKQQDTTSEKRKTTHLCGSSPIRYNKKQQEKATQNKPKYNF